MHILSVSSKSLLKGFYFVSYDINRTKAHQDITLLHHEILMSRKTLTELTSEVGDTGPTHPSVTFFGYHQQKREKKCD